MDLTRIGVPTGRARRPVPSILVAAWAAAALASPALPDTLAAQEADHPMVLDGLTFREIGPASMSGRVVDLDVVESDVDVIYVATSTGGLWKTNDRGTNFTILFDDQPVFSLGDVAVHQADTSIVWLGTGERASRQSSGWGDGVYKSTDGGVTWQNMGLRDSKHIGRVVLHPTDTALVYVAAMGHLWGPNQERGLYRSRDGGSTWERILAGDDDTGAVDVAMDPQDPNTLFAALYQRRRRPWGFHGGGPGSGLYKSTDGGDTWAELSHQGGLPEGDYGRIGISIYRTDPSIVYVSIEQGERYNASTAYEQRLAGIYRSEDEGATWEHMGDWNPRPMYASQPLVDPNDDQRIYMLNSYSFSDDGGRTFTEPDQSLHGDDRLVWVDPHDSEHVMKADDGGLGISYDRGLTWQYIPHLPVSQYYRVSYDYRDPYWVYGGLQDNGSWGGPNDSYRSDGILSQDWIRYGGGDGFLNLVDTTDNRTLYTESQYLGLSRVDMVTGQHQTIRPGDPTGAISPRRNWTTWPDPDLPDERLGNAMEPANWDGPFVISAHDANTVYAGTRRFWRSRDRGVTWEDLGDLTTGQARQRLPIMDQEPDSFTLSLDDGIPYWPTLSAIAESPLDASVLYVGTDDGLIHVSTDGGRTFTEVSQRFPGLPRMTWVNGLEASRHLPGRVYASINNYRNDDYANYLYRSDDFGQTWTSIVSNLPPNRVVRTLREDTRNPEVLYLGTEFGLFYSLDGGGGWLRVAMGLPSVAVNDLVVHPRDNDLILGTHGRGIWILDQINALQELGPELHEAPSHLFTMEPARQIRYRREFPHMGDQVFRGQNPPAGAIVDYWLGPDVGTPRLSVLDVAGTEVAWMEGTEDVGLNRGVWNLRHSLPGQGEEEDEDEEEGGFGGQRGPPRSGPSGPLVVPGAYTVRLSVGGAAHEQRLVIEEDPRLDVTPDVRARWTADLLDIAALGLRVEDGLEAAETVVEELDAGERSVSDEDEAQARDLHREWRELRSRIRRLYNEVESWVGPLTTDQASEWAYYLEMAGTLEAASE
jgi:photosystem II stability/assembly factor-like uncharacterized protein